MLADWAMSVRRQPRVDTRDVVAMQAGQDAEVLPDLEQLKADHALPLLLVPAPRRARNRARWLPVGHLASPAVHGLLTDSLVWSDARREQLHQRLQSFSRVFSRPVHARCTHCSSSSTGLGRLRHPGAQRHAVSQTRWSASDRALASRARQQQREQGPQVLEGWRGQRSRSSSTPAAATSTAAAAGAGAGGPEGQPLLLEAGGAGRLRGRGASRPREEAHRFRRRAGGSVAAAGVPSSALASARLGQPAEQRAEQRMGRAALKGHAGILLGLKLPGETLVLVEISLRLPGRRWRTRGRCLLLRLLRLPQPLVRDNPLDQVVDATGG
mmetsp:Transcript_168792/g.542491  ORF Transcript_168792/g.542491 Transcript_168792/m.542491 type:complete len:326 (+) Transcript_168792:161-1138(+)